MMLDNFPKILDAVRQAASEDSLLLIVVRNLNEKWRRRGGEGSVEQERAGKGSGGGLGVL